GYDTARLLAAAGNKVFGTMRDVKGRNAEPARLLTALGVTVVEMDVTDQASVDRGAPEILAAAGHVDVLVNNAGTAHMGTTEAHTPSSLERQLATNVVGPFRVSRAFLPGMRERRSGLVVFVSSVVGRFVVPFTGVYTSSKWALEGLAESLSYELRPFDVDVAIVEPGAYSTNIFNAIALPDDAQRLASYGDVANIFDQIATGLGDSAGNPIEVAEAIAALVAAPAGTRPLRTLVPAEVPAKAINDSAAPVQRAILEAYGLDALLPKVPVAH
ncbi:MAG: SDR family NAD(P)-dependent oxidoreductase, partial [Candidatus Eremiobacteraeota bacterium]|nr:SDR family NAD(P)-dependent oxidoreductase [Candidatus Eremiobacteraeota bacterium]